VTHADADTAHDEHALGRWLFRWRSYLPLLLLAGLAGLDFVGPAPSEALRRGLQAAGFVVGGLGLFVRLWAAGQIRPGTSSRGTKEIAAAELNTDGLYSVVRHPLYLGNLLLWLGVALIGARPGGVLLTGLVFWPYYGRIMRVEDDFLRSTFGARFEAWAARTPALLPRLSGFVGSELPYSFRAALGRDYQAIYAFVAAGFALEVVRSLAMGDGWRPGQPWWLYLGVGSLLYVTLHLLARRTELLRGARR
jgi:protein-S-isoprenylcysteine O-methyltransferase Ste14